MGGHFLWYNGDMKKIVAMILVMMGVISLMMCGGASVVKAVEGEVNGENENGSVNLTEEKEAAIMGRCDSIKVALSNLRHNDSRTRVYLGRYYETILTRFIRPLNVRLVENNSSNVGLIENQNDFTTNKLKFANDFIIYSQAMEELTTMDCKNEPMSFYQKLTEVRRKRAVVETDTKKMRELMGVQVELVKELEMK